MRIKIKSKKLLSLLLCFTMLFGAGSVMASAETPVVDMKESLKALKMTLIVILKHVVTKLMKTLLHGKIPWTRGSLYLQMIMKKNAGTLKLLIQMTLRTSFLPFS